MITQKSNNIFVIKAKGNVMPYPPDSDITNLLNDVIHVYTTKLEIIRLFFSGNYFSIFTFTTIETASVTRCLH